MYERNPEKRGFELYPANGGVRVYDFDFEQLTRWKTDDTFDWIGHRELDLYARPSAMAEAYQPIPRHFCEWVREDLK